MEDDVQYFTKKRRSRTSSSMDPAYRLPDLPDICDTSS